MRAAAYVAFRCFSHASYMARGERVRHWLLPSSHKVCAALRNAVAASRLLRTSLCHLTSLDGEAGSSSEKLLSVYDEMYGDMIRSK